MGLDVYCREDIANALLAAEEASGSTAAALMDVAGDPVRLRAYREGYRAALATVALAFGLVSKERKEQKKPKANSDTVLIDYLKNELEGYN